MSVDWAELGKGIAALVVGIGAYLVGRKPNTAKTEAAVAQARAEGAAATAEKSVVDLMREEVARLSMRVTALESREGRLIRHVYRLEGLMRGAGIEPPPFDIDGPDTKAGGTA